MDDDFDLNAFMVKYGNLFTKYFRQELNRKRLSAPGYTGRAYASKGKDGTDWKAKNKRNREFAGMRRRSPFGSNLSESIESQYNPQTQQLTILMADYWQVVDEGRKPGKYAPVDAIQQWLRKPGINLPIEASFGINRNIFKFGITPNGFYGRATDRIADKIEKEFEDNFDEMLNQLFDNLIEPNTQ
jgi:hypothetical protein